VLSLALFLGVAAIVWLLIVDKREVEPRADRVKIVHVEREVEADLDFDWPAR